MIPVFITQHPTDPTCCKIAKARAIRDYQVIYPFRFCFDAISFSNSPIATAAARGQRRMSISVLLFLSCRALVGEMQKIAKFLEEERSDALPAAAPPELRHRRQRRTLIRQVTDRETDPSFIPNVSFLHPLSAVSDRTHDGSGVPTLQRHVNVSCQYLTRTPQGRGERRLSQ